MWTAWTWMTTTSTSSPASSNSGCATCPALSWPLNSTRSSSGPWVSSSSSPCQVLVPRGEKFPGLNPAHLISSAGQPDKREVIRGVYSVIDQLSRTHLSTLERLIFHLVRCAMSWRSTASRHRHLQPPRLNCIFFNTVFLNWWFESQKRDFKIQWVKKIWQYFVEPKNSSPTLSQSNQPIVWPTTSVMVDVSNKTLLSLLHRASGSPCRRRPTGCRPTPSPSSSPPASSAVTTPSTRYWVCRTLAKPQRTSCWVAQTSLIHKAGRHEGAAVSASASE